MKLSSKPKEQNKAWSAVFVSFDYLIMLWRERRVKVISEKYLEIIVRKVKEIENI